MHGLTNLRLVLISNFQLIFNIIVNKLLFLFKINYLHTGQIQLGDTIVATIFPIFH